MAQGKQDESRKPTQRQAKAARFNDVVFIQRELSDEETKACKASKMDLDTLDKSAMSLEDQGYRISLKYDTYGTCYGAWMQHTGEKHENSGMCLTGRGSTPLKALKQLFFKHYVLLEEQWAEFKETVRVSDIDD